MSPSSSAATANFQQSVPSDAVYEAGSPLPAAPSIKMSSPDPELVSGWAATSFFSDNRGVWGSIGLTGDVCKPKTVMTRIANNRLEITARHHRSFRTGLLVVRGLAPNKAFQGPLRRCNAHDAMCTTVSIQIQWVRTRRTLSPWLRAFRRHRQARSQGPGAV